MASEVRFTFDPRDAARLAEAWPLSSAGAGEGDGRAMESVWYDTADHDLRARGVVVHLDCEGERRIQCVESEQAAGPAHEWRAELVGEHPEPTVLPEGSARRLLEQVRERVEPVFAATFTRTERRLRLPRGGEARLVIDAGELRTGEQRAPFALGRIELLTGVPAQLYQLALRLNRAAPLRLVEDGVADLGYSRLAPSAPAPSKAPKVDVDATLTAGEAFRRVAHACLAHLRANEVPAFAGDDPEGVHQMRVAARRLRSAISVFREALPRAWTDRLGREARWLAQELADAREWDVFHGETLTPLLAALPEDASLALLAERTAARVARAYERVRAAIRSPRYTGLLLDAQRWLAEAWEAPEPLPTAAAARLQDRHARVLRAGANLPALDPEGLHRLRIRVKQLRYVVEFLGDVFPGKSARRYASALAKLQESLGQLQDVAMTEQLLESLSQPEDPDAGALAHARGVVTGWQAAAAKGARRRTQRRFERFVRRSRFWAATDA